MNTKTGIAVVIAVIVVAGGFYLLNMQGPLQVPPVGDAAPQDEGPFIYTNEAFNISFRYPSDLYVFERADAGTPERPQLALFLVEDSEENRAVLEGRVPEGREYPAGVTVDVYQNPEQLTAAQWAQNDTNWTVSTGQTQPVTVNERNGFSFMWSGLYEGRTVVLTEGDKAYVFSAMWMSEDDRTLSDFDSILSSLSL